MSALQPNLLRMRPAQPKPDAERANPYGPMRGSLDRDTNAAITLAKHAPGIAAPVAPDTEERLNARRAGEQGRRRRPSVDAGRPLPMSER